MNKQAFYENGDEGVNYGIVTQVPNAMVHNLTNFAQAKEHDANRISTMAGQLVGSEILRIAAEIRALVRQGMDVCNFTVGDFAPDQFPIPTPLREGIHQALDRNETNYPPANGIPELREALQRFYVRELGLQYPVESFLVGSGARPLIYSAYRAIINPEDVVIYPVPSWNNNHYVTMLGAHGIPVVCGAETRFFPQAEALLNDLPKARLVCLNSPLNPTGTAITKDVLAGICHAIVAENRTREKRNQPPVYLLYDQIYWLLCFGDTQHFVPPALMPEMARYTILIDGISKSFAATGLRVGWAVGPVDVINQMSSIIGHIGAWAPRPEQMATTALLDDPQSMDAYMITFKEKIRSRLERLHGGIQAMKSRGLQVDSIPPMGAIYLTVKIAPFGQRTPEGQVIRSNDDVRRYVLNRARIGMIPFQAFGVPAEEGWFRMSVGAVSEDDIAQAMPRLEEALHALQ